MKPKGIGKSPKKWGKQKATKSSPPKGVQTITAMFKQQSAGLSKTSTHDTQGTSAGTDSDDVTIIEVESKYFQKTGNKDESKNTPKEPTSSNLIKQRSSSRLRLKKSVSKKVFDNDIMESANETKNEMDDDEESPSQKENRGSIYNDKEESPRRNRRSLAKRKLSEEELEDDDDFVTEEKKIRSNTKFSKRQGKEGANKRERSDVDNHESKLDITSRMKVTSNSGKRSRSKDETNCPKENVKSKLCTTDREDTAASCENKTSDSRKSDKTADSRKSSKQIRQSVFDKQGQGKKSKISISRTKIDDQGQKEESQSDINDSQTTVKSKDSKSDSPGMDTKDSQPDSQGMKTKDSQSDSPGMKTKDSQPDSQGMKTKDSQSDSPGMKTKDSQSDSPGMKTKDSKSVSPGMKTKDSQSDSQGMKTKDSKSDSPGMKTKDSQSDSQGMKTKDSQSDSPGMKTKDSKSGSPGMKTKDSKSGSPGMKTKDSQSDSPGMKTKDSKSVSPGMKTKDSQPDSQGMKTKDSQSDSPGMKTKDSKSVSPGMKTKDSHPDSQGMDSQTEGVREDLKEKYKTPYYHENFKVIMTTVLGESDYANLFNEDDMKLIGEFQTCSESAQKLYIRLFSRKLAWLPVSRIKYPEIEDDLTPVVAELAQHHLIMTADDLTDLQVTLNVLSAGDLKTLAKTYHINVTNQNKPDIIQMLIKKSKQNTIGSMFKVAGCGGSSTMVTRAKKLLGGCLHLMEEPRTVFLRLLMLFSLNDTILDEDNGTGSQGQQLFQMLQVNIGRVTYPAYTVNKRSAIFGDRDTFLRFANAVTKESDILTRIEKKDFDGAFDIFQSAEKEYDLLLRDPAVLRHDTNLPDFLRSYTACGVCVRVMNQGVEILQRRKDYTQAAKLLEKLLSQQTYCVTYRGHWWERLALNYDAHLKQPAKALKCIGEALDDKYVRTGHRLALYQRAEKICTAPKSKFKEKMDNFYHDPVLDYPEVYLDGKVLPDNVPGARFKFLMATPGSEDNPDNLTFCGVEQLVMEHYLQNGFTDGLHAEGSTVSCLFVLFFWDIIYYNIPDAFHSQFQVMPLDLHSDHFYASRKDKIDERLDLLRNSSLEDLHEMVSDVWDQHEGEACGMSWDRFNSVDHVKGLVSCFGGKAIAGILERYAKNPRQTRGGFPDLTLWDTNNNTVKICEVKGPGDRLSHKQILWLSFLITLGVDAEVCYVKAVSTKMLKHSSMTKGSA
ncbi:fanconi-associated nuclease 1-like [Argopecten irradians]|uniref:fanconi-associated nuclease 1-like n=1 Tax=Argopecten irradians TaxID=31199 RepID=UPI0037232866